jgi:hypothetical protein
MPKKRVERGLYLSNKMFHSYPNGFCGAIITGPRGIGKSSFALNAAWEMYRLTGEYDEEEAWDKVLEVCKFTMDEVLEYLEYYAKSNEKARCLIWDDCGVHASTMEWWENRSTLKRLKSVTDTIRTGVCSLIITTPNESDLTKFLRNYDDYIVQIGYHSDGGIYRMAKGYLKRTLPGGQLRIYPKFKNKFYVMIPDSVFNRYMVRRNQVLIDEIDNLKCKQKT